MEKLWLIIKREYTSRVLKKSFLLVTILTPLSIVLIAVIAGIMASSDAKNYKLALYDEANIMKLEDLKSGEYTIKKVDKASFDALKSNYTKQYDVLVKLPKLDSLNQQKLSAEYYSKEKLSITTISNFERLFDDQLSDYKLSQTTIDKKLLDGLDINVSLENALSKKSGEVEEGVAGDKSSKLSSIIATGLSYIMGFLMYMVIFIFGGMVMRSVMEEKINRVVEVMVSTVKPFQLLLGKIIGVGLVGLTQLLIWMVLIPLGFFITSSVLGIDTAAASPGVGMANPEMAQVAEAGMSEIAGKMNEFLYEVKQLNWWVIIPVFVLFFFGGYFIYSALFAAVGATIGDDIADGQQLMLPIIAPVIIAFIMLNKVMTDPNGSLAIFGSMFPLFSPILMPARLPFDPPLWQIALSVIFLIGGIVLITLFAARIYRVGIFMYGKKAGFKDIAKWVFMKE